MRPPLTVRSTGVSRLVLAFALLSSQGTASAVDPVEDLVRLLQSRPELRDEQQRTAFQKKLTERVEAIQRLGDLRRALSLCEFPVEFDMQPPNTPEKRNPIDSIYRGVRTDLTNRLQALLRKRLRDADLTRRMAAIAFLVETAYEESGRRLDPVREMAPPSSFALSMTHDLQQLLTKKDEDPRVRAAALAAVATIDPGSDKTLHAVQILIQPECEVVERRAAAKALGRMIQSLSSSRGPQRGESQRIEDSLAAFVSAAGRGLRDKKDAVVRRLCLDSIRHALERHRGENISLRVIAKVNEEAPIVVALLEDDILEVRLSAYQVLEKTATIRRMQIVGAMLPTEAQPATKKGFPSAPGRRDERFSNAPPPPAAPVLDKILSAMPNLVHGLSDKEVRVRLAAIYVLESLGPEAAPAVEGVARTLKVDKNGFVRWGAARVFLNMAPLEPEKAVPALAEALSDANKTVRLTAAQALVRFGSQAKEAVKALSEAVGDEESNVRITALNALKAIGLPARPAIGVLVSALADKKSEVRAGAAKALAHLGPLDEKTRKELAKLLEDADAEVRLAASESLLDN